MKNLLSLLAYCMLFITTTAFAQEEYKADCLILEDENSIICKYIFPAKSEDAVVTVNWIDPNGELSRSRTLEIPAEHISVYDFRYLKGRAYGQWKFEVVDADITTSTTFTIGEKTQD